MTATTTRRATLPNPDDDREPRAVGPTLAPAGQLVLVGAAQLGLDGRAYALPDPPSRDAASSPLGTPPGILQEREGTGENHPAAPFSPAQLSLNIDQWREAAQLTLWYRLRQKRDLLIRTEFDRDAKCHFVRFSKNADVFAARADHGGWGLRGVVLCGKMSCPACGAKRARETANALGAAFEAHRSRFDVDADLWMLTFTLPHYITDHAKVAVEQLYAAHAAFLRSRDWRDFRRRWGLETNGVRVLDIVHGGPNGMHPHFHVALFPTKAGLGTHEEWQIEIAATKPRAPLVGGMTIVDAIDDPVLAFFGGAWQSSDITILPTQLADKLRTFGPWRKLAHCADEVRAKYLDDVGRVLVPAWERACREAGVRIDSVENFRKTALKLSPSEDAHMYFTKWGLHDEVGKPTSKNFSHLRLLDAAAAGLQGAAYMYKQFRVAVDGRTWITGVSDTCKKLGVTDEKIEAWSEEWKRRREVEMKKQGLEVKKVRTVGVYIRAHLWTTALALTLDETFAYLDAMAERYDDDDKVQLELDFYLTAHKQLQRERERERHAYASSS